MEFLLGFIYVAGMISTYTCLLIYGTIASGLGTDSIALRQAKRRMHYMWIWPIFWLVILPLKLLMKKYQLKQEN